MEGEQAEGVVVPQLDILKISNPPKSRRSSSVNAIHPKARRLPITEEQSGGDWMGWRGRRERERVPAEGPALEGCADTPATGGRAGAGELGRGW